jgi:Holliday junction resolvase RusA-like endonuclease
MTDPIVITLPGPVVGKGRPKFARLRNGGVTTRTPEKTRSYEGALRLAADQAMAGRPPIDTPVAVLLKAAIEVPDSWPTWKVASAFAGGVRPTTKPDIDNVAKAVLDAFNGIVWTDDTMAVRVTVEKVYADRPGLEVTVWPLAALPAQVKRRPAA